MRFVRHAQGVALDHPSSLARTASAVTASVDTTNDPTPAVIPPHVPMRMNVYPVAC